MILLSHRPSQHVDLDVRGFCRQPAWRRRELLLVVQRVQQADAERARGAEAGLRRRVRNRADVDAIVDLEKTEALTNDGVLNLVDRIDELRFRIIEPDAFVEQRRMLLDGDVDVRIDARAQDRSVFVGAIERGKVGPSAREADAKRRLRNDHPASPCRTPVISMTAPWRAAQLTMDSSVAGTARTAAAATYNNARGLALSMPMRKRVRTFCRRVTRLMELSTQPYGSCSNEKNRVLVTVRPSRSNCRRNPEGVK